MMFEVRVSPYLPIDCETGQREKNGQFIKCLQAKDIKENTLIEGIVIASESKERKFSASKSVHDIFVISLPCDPLNVIRLDKKVALR